MDRRAFIGTLAGGLLAAPLVAEGQPAGKVWRIAYLGNSSAALESELVAAFRQGLRDLNYVEGRNIAIEYRWAEGQYDRFPGFVAEAVQSKVDVIVTAGTPAILAAKEGTRTIPVVMAVIGHMESRISEARGCLLMIGWLYVIGLFVGLVLAGWDVLSSGLRDVLRWESLSGVLLAIVWPLIILALAAGHGAPPMPLGFGSLCYRLCWPGSRWAGGSSSAPAGTG